MRYLVVACTCRRHNVLGPKTMGTCMTVGPNVVGPYDRSGSSFNSMCRMHTLERAGNPVLLDTYLSLSKGIWEMERALLRCGQMVWPAYQLPQGGDFKSYFGACAYGKCPRKGLLRASPFDGSQPSACGWDSVFGDDCPLECNDQPFEWQEWKQQLRGSDHDGQPSYAPELVPVQGTRRQFFAFQRNAIAVAMPHRYGSKMLRRGLKV